MIDPRLITLLTLIEEKNYTKTAEKLNFTQPSVTHHIKGLELEYGVSIFKNLKDFELTEDGKLLKDYAEYTRLEHEQFVNKIKMKGNRAIINIGLTPMVSTGMNQNQRNIISKFGEYNSNIYVLSYNSIVEKLNLGDLDFAIVDNSFDSAMFDSALLNKCNICLIASSNGIYKNKNRITREQLMNAIIVLSDESSGLTKSAISALNQKNIKLKRNDIIHATDITWLVNQVKRNDAIGFVYEEAVKDYIDDKSISKMELLNFNASQNIYLIYTKSAFKNQIVLDAIDELKRYEGIYGEN